MKLTVEVISGKSTAKSINETVAPKSEKPSEDKEIKAAATLEAKRASSAKSLASRAISIGKNIVVQSANFYLSDIGRRNGDSNYQAIINRKLEVLQDTGNVAKSAVEGAIAGAGLGIPGIVLGGLLGAASAGVNIGFKYAERERAYQHEMFKENNSQAYNLARANYSALTGRLR